MYEYPTLIMVAGLTAVKQTVYTSYYVDDLPRERREEGEWDSVGGHAGALLEYDHRPCVPRNTHPEIFGDERAIGRVTQGQKALHRPFRFEVVRCLEGVLVNATALTSALRRQARLEAVSCPFCISSSEARDDAEIPLL